MAIFKVTLAGRFQPQPALHGRHALPIPAEAHDTQVRVSESRLGDWPAHSNSGSRHARGGQGGGSGWADGGGAHRVAMIGRRRQQELRRPETGAASAIWDQDARVRRNTAEIIDALLM